ncbi:MAG TPA: phenylalanine--tRNA ligase subunit alpha [Chitinophagaceae bacterium]|nr:MAG: phenylalanyl-tRNA synthetase subunit alpha [Bacteroidetes bacterium OLB11]HMN33231.1 phenylalanine--tRNA ligase subunit alpha [Chitinophagaceae bacterium]
MQELADKIQSFKKEIQETIVQGQEQLEQFRIRFLGTKGIIKQMMGEMKSVPNEMKKDFGALLNEFKQFAELKYEEAKSANSEKSQVNSESTIDYSLPGYPSVTGSRHPIQLTMNKMISIFEKIGFTVAEGPEIEDDWHNFTALNLPEDHPARDMQDTFYISKNPDWLLRTHTSSIQVRVMQEGKLPIRQIFPGRVYRNETISSRSHCVFHQIEGLYIDEKVSFADLKQTLYYFVKELFGENVKVRFRPSYFPFTEPSAEMDVSCFICNSKGCNVCKQTGWVEILGCGMVHPQVLKNCGIDPEKYTGFAWGMGVERTTMMMHGIKDIRLLSENDMRFLSQFKSVI